VVVIGAGPRPDSGYELTRRGTPTIVLDQDHPGRGLAGPSSTKASVSYRRSPVLHEGGGGCRRCGASCLVRICSGGHDCRAFYYGGRFLRVIPSKRKRVSNLGLWTSCEGRGQLHRRPHQAITPERSSKIGCATASTSPVNLFFRATRKRSGVFRAVDRRRNGSERIKDLSLWTALLAC